MSAAATIARSVDTGEMKARLNDRAEAFAAHILPAGKRDRNEWKVGSVHGEAGQSLGIEIAGPNVGLWHDRATGEGGDWIALYEAVRKVDFLTAVSEICDWLGVDRPDREPPAGGRFQRPKPAAVPAERPDDYIGPFYNDPHQNYLDSVWAADNGFDAGDPPTLAKIAEACDGFEAALPVPGSIAETYVRARIPGLADDFAWNHDAIRYEPEAWHPYLQRKLPALVCKAIRAHTAQFCGVQRVYLRDDGSSRLPDAERGRLSFGRLVNAVVKLSPQRAEDGEIIITEGVVKGLAAIDCGIPGVVCAALGTSGLAGFPHLAGVSRLGIIPDRDDAGRQAAEALAHRYRWRGTPVRIVAPPWGKDLDDFIREGIA